MMWDNSETLISYIRHTFITCDDTGVCEAALKLPGGYGEKPGAIRVFHEQGRKQGGNDVDDDQNEGSSTSDHSPDIHADVGHRRRSETSKRLETLKLQRIAQSKIRTVQWKEPSTSTSLENTPLRRIVASNGPVADNNNSAPLFTKVDEKDFNKAPPARTSVVSKLIRACPDLPLNPFQEYMKFDGNASISTSARTIRVFPLMAYTSSGRLKPLEVSVTGTAKVSDLIGLICFHYTSRNLTPKLSTDTNRYALFVAEDTGEVDSDLPPRSPHENVSRFHFPYLALVDRGAASSSSGADGSSSEASKKYYVMVHVSTGDKFKLEFDTLDTPLRTVRDSALAMRFAKNEKLKRSMEYNIEKLNDPNSPLPLDATVSNAGTTEFVLVRAHSARGELTPSSPTVVPPDYVAATPAFQVTNAGPACHFYSVTMVRKFKRDVKVQLIISRERVEISPINSDEPTRKFSTNSAAKLFRPLRRQQPGNGDVNLPGGSVSKTVDFLIHRIGGGEIIEEKASRKIFRIVHKHQSSSGGSSIGGGTVGEWKSHQFETETATAEEIVRTLNRYLDLARSDIRQEFLRRTPRKSSFFKRLQLGDLSFGEASGGGGASGTTPQN